MFQERQAREQAYLTALEALAAHALATGEMAAAERYLRRAVAVDPFRETGYRALMQALAAAGNYAAAMQVYRELRLRLHREINAGPDAETTALYEQLRAEARAKVGARGQAAGDSELKALSPKPHGDVTPVDTPDPRLHHLPLPLTRLIGREQQSTEVKQLLVVHRLVTLTGAGGCGKTRLALQVAMELVEAVPDGARCAGSMAIGICG